MRLSLVNTSPPTRVRQQMSLTGVRRHDDPCCPALKQPDLKIAGTLRKYSGSFQDFMHNSAFPLICQRLQAGIVQKCQFAVIKTKQME